MLAMIANDSKMMDAYKNKKDLYAIVACNVFNNTYWDNMETHEDGTPNPEGKKRRSFCKSVVLGLMYGRSAASIAEQTGSSVEEAQNIINNFYNGFPNVKKWVQKTESDAKVNGYVEDFWGRRRRIPDLLLPNYTVKLSEEKRNSSATFNPILGSCGVYNNPNDTLIKKYTYLLDKAKSRADISVIRNNALKEGVEIIDNGGFISRAERQCINARIQGSAATMTKIAMRKIYEDKVLRDLGFNLIITVHDELIGECPLATSEQAAERLSYIMSNSINEYTDMPFNCDAEIEHCWYFNTYMHDVVEELYELSLKMSWDDVCEQAKKTHIECTEEELQELLSLTQQYINSLT